MNLRYIPTGFHPGMEMAEKTTGERKFSPKFLAVIAIIAILVVVSLITGWQLIQAQQQLAEQQERLKQQEERLKQTEEELQRQQEQLKQTQEELQKLKTPYELVASLILKNKDEVVKDKKYASASKWQLSTYSALLFTPDEKYLVVADYKNKVICLDTDVGKVVWEREFPERMGYSICMSPDGAYVYIGFRSLDGELTCLKTSSGEVVWEWKASEDLGPGDPKYYSYYWPTIFSIQVSPDGGHIYVVARKMEKQGKTKVNIARAYCIDAASGEIVWKYPQEGFIDSCIPHATLSSNGKYFAFQTWWYGEEWGPYKVVVLDSTSGELLYVVDVNKTICEAFPDNPIKPPTAWHGADFSGDGEKLVIVARSGILIVVDHKKSVETGEPIISKVIRFSTPLPADVITKEGNLTQGYIYAYTGYVKCIEDKIFVFSSNTYAFGVRGGRPALDHPNASKVFVFDLALELLWVYDMGGKVGYGFNFIGYSADGRVIAIPVGQNWIKMSNDPSGVLVFDLSRKGTIYDKVLFRYHTEGTAIAAAVSSKGRYVAVIELPIDVAPPGSPVKIVGEYRLLLFKLNV